MDPVTLGVVALMGAVEPKLPSSTCSTNGTFTPYDKQGNFW